MESSEIYYSSEAKDPTSKRNSFEKTLNAAFAVNLLNYVTRTPSFHILSHQPGFKYVERARDKSTEKGCDRSTQRIVDCWRGLKIVFFSEELEDGELNAGKYNVSHQS
jgi:hypothetical protein